MEVLIFAVLGLAGGILVNILADRLPAELSPAGGWVCPNCGRALSFPQGIGLWRELSGRTRCTACQAHLPLRHALVEVGLAALFAFLWLRYGWSADFGLDVLFLVILALVFVVDLEHRLVLNVVVGPAAVLAVLAAPIRPGLVSALVGGAVGFVLLWALVLVTQLVYPGGLGAGDVKLAGLLGLMLGWPNIWLGLFVGSALAAAMSLGLLATRRAGMRTYIPYAPFLVVGAYLTLLLTRY